MTAFIWLAHVGFHNRVGKIACGLSELVFESPVAWTAKRLQLNWTATNCNQTSGWSPSGLLSVAVAVAPNSDGLVDWGKTG
jgi:hypothetical protein